MRVLLCFQITQNVRFNWNMYNFKFNYLFRGQLVSLDLLAFIRNITRLWGFFGNLIIAIIARMLCRNHLNSCLSVTEQSLYSTPWPQQRANAIPTHDSIEQGKNEHKKQVALIRNLMSHRTPKISTFCDGNSTKFGRYCLNVSNKCQFEFSVFLDHQLYLAVVASSLLHVSARSTVQR